jgi:predicted RNA-binding protein with PUA-like domain
MNYWLLKTEPSVYSFADLQRDRKTTWDGVSNNVALKHLRSMKKGDSAFLYHTGNEKAIVGIVDIASAPFADPKNSDPRLVVVDIKPREPLAHPVTLAQVKADPAFREFALVRLSRLSVMPVSESHWKRLLSLSR